MLPLFLERQLRSHLRGRARQPASWCQGSPVRQMLRLADRTVLAAQSVLALALPSPLRCQPPQDRVAAKPLLSPPADWLRGKWQQNWPALLALFDPLHCRQTRPAKPWLLRLSPQPWQQLLPEPSHSAHLSHLSQPSFPFLRCQTGFPVKPHHASG